MADPDLEINVLGPLQMTLDGAAIPLGTPKQRAVLAMLVMNRTVNQNLARPAHLR